VMTALELEQPTKPTERTRNCP